MVPLSTKHGTKNFAPLAPWPRHRYLSKLGGGGGGLGGCRIQGPGPAAPPGVVHAIAHSLHATIVCVRRGNRPKQSFRVLLPTLEASFPTVFGRRASEMQQ